MALRFNRPFRAKIKAISFDLDDTLYQNDTVIHHAEQVQFAAICDLVPEFQQKGPSYWLDLKWQVAKQNPDIQHDVNQWRQGVIDQGLASYIVDKSKRAQLTKQVFDAFYHARSDFKVPAESLALLAKLTEKYPLIAVTNGNADINRIGLAPYFINYYRAGEQGTRMKPFPDMLTLAAKHLDMPAQHILHIGDSPASDIQAALNAGCASLWYNPKEDVKTYGSGYALADGEYSDLADLYQLL